MFIPKYNLYSEDAKPIVSDSLSQALNIGAQSTNVNMLLTEEANYTSLFDTLYNQLNKKSWHNIHDIETNIKDPSQYQRMRSEGVKTAWQYEEASIKLGGKGSENWNSAERAEILDNGRLKRFKNAQGKWDGAQGHHQMNVHDHPEFMTEADNIKFYRTRSEHLQQGHDGNFKNESDKPFIDKSRMLIHDYENGLLMREIYAAGSAAIIGFSASASLSLIIELSNNGIDPSTVKDSLTKVSKEGAKGAGISTLYYGGFRLGGIGIDKAVEALSAQLSPKVAELIKSNGGKMGILGGAIILADGVWQTTKDLNNGETWGTALSNTAQKEALPIGLLALTIYYAPAGLIATAASIAYSLGKGLYDSHVMEKVEAHRINYMYEKIMKEL